MSLLIVEIIGVLAIWQSRKDFPPAATFPVHPVSGAAVFYYRAFAAMPKLSEEEKSLKLLTPQPDEPLDKAKSDALIARFEPSFKLLAEGAKEPKCDWGLDLNLGLVIPRSYITNETQLMQALALQARLHLEEGNASAAVDDLLLGFRFSRHVGEADLIIDYLVQLTGEMIPINFAARHLPEFDAASLQKLSEGIAALPPPRSLRSVMAINSRVDAAYLRRIFSRENARKTRQAMADQAEAQRIPTEISTVQTLQLFYLNYMVSRLERHSKELEKAMSIPFPEGRPSIEAFTKLDKVSKWEKLLDFFSCKMLPANASARINEVQMEMIWTILRTALDAQIHNPGGLRGELAKLRDPYDKGPLECQEVKGGVKITLKTSEGRKHLTLMVGLSGK